MNKKIPFFHQIRFRLVFGFLVPVIFIIILGVVSYNKASNQIIVTYEESVEQTVNMMNRYLSLTFNTVQSNYKNYLNDSELQKFFKGLYDDDPEKHFNIPATYDDTFDGAVTGDNLISDIYMLSDIEKSIATTKTTESGLLSAFAETTQGQIVSNNKNLYYLFGNQCSADEKLNTTSNDYAARLVRYFNNAPAIMVIDFKRSIIDETLATLDGGPGSYVGLITCDNVEFLSSNSAVHEGNVFIDMEYVIEAQNSDSINGSLYVDNGNYLFLYSKIDTRNAMVCALIPRENILGQTSEIQMFTFIIVILASVTAIALGFILSSQYSNAINKIISITKQVAEGDLSVNITTNRKDEFRLLTDGLSDMLDKMQSLVSGIKDVNDELSNATNDMTDASLYFLNSSENIKNEIIQMQTGIKQLDDETSDCMGQMDSLSHIIGEVANNSSQIDTLAKSTANVVTSGLDSVKQLKESTGSTIKITSTIIESIENLAEKSKAIGSIIKTINEIAEQTNLLSLNASIEAARAGEAGKGFSVVAMEIQKLADESLASAEKIATIINEIEENTSVATDVVRKAEHIVDGQSKAVDLTADTFNHIHTQVTDLLHALELINASITSMEEGRNSTLNSITAISSISVQAASGTNNVREAALSQSASIDGLDKSAKLLERRATELSVLLEKFRV